MPYLVLGNLNPGTRLFFTLPTLSSVVKSTRMSSPKKFDMVKLLHQSLTEYLVAVCAVAQKCYFNL
jgi:hypothetical protein